jgi:hypothetical protein
MTGRIAHLKHEGEEELHFQHSNREILRERNYIYNSESGDVIEAYRVIQGLVIKTNLAQLLH